jgi:hypothetical protein
MGKDRDGNGKMEDGRWKMEDGRWEMEDGRWVARLLPRKLSGLRAGPAALRDVIGAGLGRFNPDFALGNVRA